MKARILLGPVALACLVGCVGDRGNTRVSWVRQGDSASFRLPTHAVWCADLGWLELVAARNDTGVGIAVFPTDSVFTGHYRVFSVRERGDSTRPASSLAVRWFSTTELLAFEAYQGEVVIEGDRLTIHGRFEGRLLVPSRLDSLELSGDFRDVPVTWGGVECEVQADSAATDSGEVLD